MPGLDPAEDEIPIPRLDVTKPNIARVYDYFAGGKDNFAADREFAREASQRRRRAGIG
jgi:hypothetical protein